MNRTAVIRLIAPLLAVFALTSCMLVEDFAPQWDKGVTDSCTMKIAESLYLSEFRRDPEGKEMEKFAREFSLGKEHFLMLKQDEADKGGRLYRFGVTNGIFRRYRLDPAMRKTFEKDYPNAPVSLAHDTIELKDLSSKVTDLLSEIAAKPEYWQVEDQTLYNVMRNPLCKFEDRDLKALAEQDKPKSKTK